MVHPCFEHAKRITTTEGKVMKRLDMWDAFAKTGRVEDYLRYLGVDVYDIPHKEDKRHHDNRRPDHQGEQQHR